MEGGTLVTVTNDWEGGHDLPHLLCPPIGHDPYAHGVVGEAGLAVVEDSAEPAHDFPLLKAAGHLEELRLSHAQTGSRSLEGFWDKGYVLLKLPYNPHLERSEPLLLPRAVTVVAAS